MSNASASAAAWTWQQLAATLTAAAAAAATNRKEVILGPKPETAAEIVHLSWVNASRL